jgi:polysaccharide biosynthesis protein PelA
MTMLANLFARLGPPWVQVSCAAALVLLSAVCARPVFAAACQRTPQNGVGTVAWFYGEQVPVEQLSRFDTVVVEADSGFDPRSVTAATEGETARCTNWYAYVSVGEVTKDRDYFAAMPRKWLIGRNTTWASAVVDQSAPGWPQFFVEHVIAPLWARGYRGFFLDTLDSWQLIAKTDAARARQQAGLVNAIRALKARYPDAQLILNRGFEILPEIYGDVAAVAFESLYGNWNQAAQRYDAVPADDRAWLLGQARTIRERYRLPVISIDYCAPDDTRCQRDIAAKICAEGIAPYVTDGALRTVGVGADAACRARLDAAQGAGH